MKYFFKYFVEKYFKTLIYKFKYYEIHFSVTIIRGLLKYFEIFSTVLFLLGMMI